ncbi:MAG TPA: rod shape-determining protein RodA [Candidatus Portnoybacteria bacterium]|nr:rod shape-determining protein RodA [Candidatus Portnoybacteria bacterium]
MNLEKIKNLDWIMLTVIFLLIGLGLVTIASTLYPTNLINFKRQIIFAGFGLALMLLISFLNYRVLKNYTLGLIFLYLISIGLLVAVLFWGTKIRGSSSWFSLGPLSLQPVEILKPVLIIVLAKYFADHYREMYRLRHLFISGLIVALPAGLILIQPDLGSLLVIIGIWLGLMILSGIKLRHLLLLGVVGCLITLLSWFFFLQDYQKARILAFINPNLDPLGQGYNVIQSIIAVGSGGLLGKGLGQGTQSQLNFLPEQHTDFIFAVVAEEWGFIGVLFVLILFGVLFFRLIKVALASSDNFGRLLSAGVAIMLFFHLIINIGMNMGLVPITGIPLPLLSYGGSSLVATLISLGLVQGVKIRST